MYCHCGKKFTAGRIALGPAGWTHTQVQYCGTCDKMSYAVQEKEPVKYGPLGARAPQNWIGNADGTAFIDWWTTTPGEKVRTMDYSPYPFRKVNGMDQERNHLLQIWHKLDTEIYMIRSTEPGKHSAEELAEMKGMATAYAYVLAQLMAPFYADKDAVLAESMKRWKAHESSTEHQTPGLAEHVWDPSSRFEGTAYTEAAEKAARNDGAVTKSRVKLDEQKVTFINHCLSTGSMEVKQLATMFSVSIDDIKAVVK